MKKQFLSGVMLLASLWTGCAYGQESVNSEGWMGSVEFDPAVIPSKGKDVVFSARLTATHKVMPLMSMGAGISLRESWKFNAAPSMDVFARVHLEDFNREFTPILDLDLGYNQSFANTDVRGFMFNPTLGIRYGHFGFGVGYYGTVYSGSLYSNFNFRLSYNFGYHKAGNFRDFIRKVDFGVALGAVFPFSNGMKGDNYISTGLSGAVELTGLYRFSNNFSGGLMLGFNCGPYKIHDIRYEENSTGCCAFLGAIRGRYDFRQLSFTKKGIHPYAKMDVGVAYSLEFTPNWEKVSFYYSPGVGLSLPVKQDTQSVDLGISYAPIRIDKYEGSNWKFHDLGSLRLTLGYTF